MSCYDQSYTHSSESYQSTPSDAWSQDDLSYTYSESQFINPETPLTDTTSPGSVFSDLAISDMDLNPPYDFYYPAVTQSMQTIWDDQSIAVTTGPLYTSTQAYLSTQQPCYMSRPDLSLDTIPFPTGTYDQAPSADVTLVDLTPHARTRDFRNNRPSYIDNTVVDPTAEDFSTYIDLNAGESNKQPSRRTSNVTSNESDEGRYRTDPLYSREQSRDGMYHCPFEAEGCRHPATKLKCNYDKYVDSHLRPFKCKVATCSKQSFSSTACLLRHEREAHGMHGHGKCPYLCEFDGCDRADPDKGFPRLYNLRDHMKRVHAWKESDEDARKNSRKRRATAAKPPAQRQRTSVVSLDISQLECYPVNPGYSYGR